MYLSNRNGAVDGLRHYFIGVRRDQKNSRQVQCALGLVCRNMLIIHRQNIAIQRVGIYVADGIEYVVQV